jgi:hypothetical protein
MTRKSFMLALLACLSAMAWADWSPEILIWQNPPEVAGGGTETAMAVDSRERVHIVFTHTFRIPENPFWPRTGISYVQFDDHGNLLVPEVFLSDSLDEDAGYPRLALFGEDSLWAMWCGGRMSPPHTALKYVPLDMEGHILRPAQDFPRAQQASRLDYALTVAEDRTVVIADASLYWDSVYVTVVTPDGQRPLDDAAIWAEPTCYGVCGYVDHTDSLQVAWTQGAYPEWWAAYSKRVSIRTPFDPALISEYVLLTPRTRHGPADIRPVGDSLIALLYGGYDDQGRLINLLRLLRRDTYEVVSDTTVGISPGYVQVALEGDTALSTLVGSPAGDRRLWVIRYRLPTLAGLDTTLIAQPDPSWTTVSGRAYAVSPAGVRHVLYLRDTGSGPGSVRLYYRYWRSDLSVGPTLDRPGSEVFRVWPNPTNRTVTLSGPVEAVRSVVLYNLLGQRVQTWSPSSNYGRSPELNLDLHAVHTGTYYLQVTTPQHVLLEKLQLIR